MQNSFHIFTLLCSLSLAGCAGTMTNPTLPATHPASPAGEIAATPGYVPTLNGEPSSAQPMGSTDESASPAPDMMPHDHSMH